MPVCVPVCVCACCLVQAVASSAAGSGFGAGEAFASQEVLFAVERDFDDSLSESSTFPRDYAIGAAVLLLVWMMVAMGSFHSNVYSQMVSADWQGRGLSCTSGSHARPGARCWRPGA